MINTLASFSKFYHLNLVLINLILYVMMSII